MKVSSIIRGWLCFETRGSLFQVRAFHVVLDVLSIEHDIDSNIVQYFDLHFR